MLFYDSELELFINDEPLLISSKTQNAAKDIGINLSWDQNGYIHKVSHADVMDLSAKLGMVVLSVKDFMSLVQREPRVASHKFAEWLQDSYELTPEREMRDSTGKILDVPSSRPGWFDLDNVGADGLPTSVSMAPGANKWKFWTQNDASFRAGAVRSFVTSPGSCSLDLGIPVFARHPNFMIRECYRSKPSQVDNPIDSIWEEYEKKTLQRNDEEILSFFRNLDLSKLDKPVDGMDGFLLEKNGERLNDLAGKKRLIEGNFEGLKPINLNTMITALSSEPNDHTTYVTGHEHPDADAVVGAVFEAVRRHVYYGKPCAVWSQRIPYVVRHILGPQICDAIINTPMYGPTHDIILVDCHSFRAGREYQVKGIIDHHIVSRTLPYYISISQEVSWSSTVQIYVKFLGCGLDLDPNTAKIMLKATLVEAEPSLMDKMSELDRIVLRRLKTLALESASYPSLMGLLTRDTMSGDPFMMDYKEGIYGFSVIKTQQATSYASQAKANNKSRNLPLTVVKQVIYNTQFDRVVQEKISMFFNDRFHDKGFRSTILNIVKSACTAMHGYHHVSCKGNDVVITDVPHQTPRLLLAPLLEGIVREHLRFFRAKSIGMYVSCGFYTNEQGDYGQVNKEPSVKTGITFNEVKALLAEGSPETSLMTLPQYWRVYRECLELNDSVTLKSLRDSDHVELLDTVFYHCSSVKHGNHKQSTQQSILMARPSLIRPDDINLKTGLPDRLTSPDNYGDTELWRYWSPDREENVATRGHIFVMDQTCIDLKIGTDERTQQLTFRPIYRDIPDIHYDMELKEDKSWIKVNVFPRLFSIRTQSTGRIHRLSVSKLAHDFSSNFRTIGKEIHLSG